MKVVKYINLDWLPDEQHIGTYIENQYPGLVFVSRGYRGIINAYNRCKKEKKMPHTFFDFGIMTRLYAKDIFHEAEYRALETMWMALYLDHFFYVDVQQPIGEIPIIIERMTEQGPSVRSYTPTDFLRYFEGCRLIHHVPLTQTASQTDRYRYIRLGKLFLCNRYPAWAQNKDPYYLYED